MNLQFSSIFTLQRLLACLSLAVLCSLFSPATADATVGGPDDEGYIFIDSLETQCNTAFTDISSTGTSFNPGYYGGVSVTLPFDFTFYGQASPNLYIRNHGAVQFGDTNNYYAFSSNSPLPTSETTEPAWFPYWDTLDNDSGNVYYETLGMEPNRRFIVQWHNRDHGSLSSDQTITFQLVLYEGSNNFDFVYGDVVFGNAEYDSGASATIGIQGPSGASYLQYSYNDNSFFNSGITAICFSDGTPLTITANTDQASPGDSITYTLKLENYSNLPFTDVVITDTLPSSFTVTSVISNGLSITETSTQPYVWQVGDMQPGSGGTITVVGTIDNDLALLGTTLTNTAYITGNGMISSQPITATVHIPGPDLSSSYKLAPAFTNPNSILNYQIVITNSAVMTASDIILTDPIPTSTVYITGSVTGGTYNSSLDQIEWSGDLGPSAGMTITYAVSVTALSAPIITNTATLVQTNLSTPLSISAKTKVIHTQSVADNFCVNFEEGTLPGFMIAETTESGTAFGQVQVAEQYAHTGDYALHLDTGGESTYYSGGYTTQAAVMLLDMSAVTDAYLNFWLYNHGDNYHPSQDGLFISDDGGATYSQIFNFNDSYYNSFYQEYTVDLGEVLTSRGMTLTADFRLKFQSYDDGPISNDGFSIDDICITMQPAEIDVQGNGVPIADGSLIADMANNTDFGEVSILDGRVEQTFTVHNTGSGMLLLSEVEIGGPHAENFEVVQQPPLAELASGLSTSFRVAFSTTVAALRQAVVNVFSSDGDEGIYNFNIQGRGVIPVGIDDGSTLKIDSATHEFVEDYFSGYGSEPFNLDIKGVSLASLSYIEFDVLYDSDLFYVRDCSSDYDLIICNSQNQDRVNIQINDADGISGDETLVSVIIHPRNEESVGEFQISPVFLVNTDRERIIPTVENGEITIVPQLEPTETPTLAPTPTPAPTPTLPPGIDDGSTIRIESYTHSNYDASYPVHVEGLNLSSLTRAKFEVIYDNSLFEVFHCSAFDLPGTFTLTRCEIDDSAGKIEIELEASEGVSGDKNLVSLEMLPYYDEVVGVFQIVPTLFMNEAGEVIEPTIENGEITMLILEPTETPAPATPTATPCPQATQEPFRADPIDSPVHTITQTVTIYIGNGESVTISGDSGIFTATGSFDYGDNPAQVEITLLPDQVNTFTVEALVKSATVGDCPYGGYTLGQTLRIEHQTLAEPTDTPAPTDTATVAPTDTLMPTDTPMSTETATAEPTDTLMPTETATVAPTDTLAPTDTPLPADTATVAPIDTPMPADTATVAPTDTPLSADTATAEPTDTPLSADTATAEPTDKPLPADTATVAPIDTPLSADTVTVEPTDTPMPVDTATVAPTDMLAPTEAATEAPADTPAPTNTMTAVPTDTLVPTDTAMPASTATPAIIPSATAVPTFTDMPTDIPTEVPTDTPQPTATMTAIPTDTAIPTATDTATPLPTDTATSMPTDTATSTPTFIPTDTPLPTVTHTPTLIPAKLVGEIRASQTVFQRGSQIRYDLSIENQGETMAENVRLEITIPNGLRFVEDQPLPWQLKEGRNNARQNAGSVYELSLDDLAPQSTTDKFILLSVAEDLASDEDVDISAPSMTVVADGDVEPFTADVAAGTNIIIEADEGETPTNLEEAEELSIKIFLPIIEQ